MRRVVGLASDELATRERVFDGLTMKAVRRSLRALSADVEMLTAAGYDPNQSRDRIGRWTDGDLGPAYDAGFTVDEAVQGGLGSVGLEKLTLSSGAKVYRKTTPSAKQTDREVAAARVLNALGVDDFQVVRTGENQFIMTDVRGVVGEQAIKDAVTGGASLRDAYVDAVSRPGGKQIALVDWLTSNGDRNTGNFVITPKGDVRGFDHGDSMFIDYGVPSSPFVSYWMNPEATGINPRFTAEELTVARRQLEELRDEFAAEGHADWHETIMKRLTQLEDAVPSVASMMLSQTPSEPNPTIPAGALGVVTTTWTQEVDEVLFPYLVQTFVDAAEDVYAAMPETTGVAPKITYDLAASYLRSASSRLKGIGDLVWADMREQLALGYEAGESINQLAARLRTVAKISEPRALTIARTEVVPAANFGSLMQLKAVGFADEECRKEWLATEDARTRPAHLEADGQLVGLNQPFVVGGDFLQVPGDPAGRAENVINCRCSVAYVFDEDGDEDGDEPLVADAAFEAKHPRQSDGRFGTKSPFTILPEAERGRPGNKLYAPGMLGQYGGAGLMMRHVGADGVPRYMVVQRGPNNFKSKWLWQLPGGSRDENETAAQAAARETFEEIGFTQEQLDTLEPRGAHVVKLPVEGKDPWTYSNVVADAPAAFKPRIDYTELGAARWLTYDQLVEMRGRGRLIAPFAAQLEDIIAKFDAPVVAGFLVTDVTTSQDHVGYYALMTASKSHWTAADEAKVKRDAEGKFAKKAGAKIVQHVPIHINTAVIYKKGGHKPNEVIAEKAGTTATDGVAQRLIWHAGAKKFMLQAQADNGVDWISVESYSKKAAYDKFSKETGWTKPAKAESVVAIAPPAAKAAPSLKDVAAQQVADKTAATPIVVKEMKEVAPQLGKPIHINTTAIYKTKYADGAIVAERELSDDLDTVQQLRWDAKSKKFVLLENVGNGWKTVALYNKGETYQKFSKQTGWTHPVAKPPTPLTPKPTPSINLPDLDSMNPVKALASILGMTSDDWQKLNPQQKAYVNDKIEELDSLGEISPTQYEKYEKITGKAPSAVGPAKPTSGVSLDQIMKALTTSELLSWIDNIPVGDLGTYGQDDLENLKAKVGKLLIAGDIDYDAAIAAGDKIDQAMVPSIVEIPDFDDDAPSKIANFYDNLTQDDFDSLSASDQVQVAQNASFYDSVAPSGVSYSDKIDSFVAGKGDADATTGKKIDYALESAILMMTQSEYDALSKDEKIKLYEDSKTLADPTGAINKKIESLIKTHMENKPAATGTPARTPTASPKVTFDWDDNSGPHGMTPIYYEGQLIGHAESSNNGSEAQLYDLNPVSPSSSYGQFVGVVNFDEGESIPNAVIDLVDSGMLSVPSAGVGPGYVPNVVDDGSMGDFVDSFLQKDMLAQSGIINFMSNADVDKLTPSEYAAVAAQAAYLYQVGFLSQKDFDEFNAKGTKTAVPNVTKAPASAVAPAAVPTPVTGSKFFVDVHGKIKKTNEISTPASPAPPPSMYKIKTPSGAAAMQQTMLSAAGKTWTGVQVAAIKKYGTSVGYRSINAVLRDDPKQLKLFNDSQLADAVKHAVNLQNAMTPLTDDVKLFRGTGAHAFGQNSISANFDELKKLQGSVVTDKGFLSTTVDENKGVSYDYAKKPIQVVFSAPVGTPALHVDSAIPGHSEHEVLLAAGTSYRIDEVRKATDADRVKYGNSNLEHVVEATIVPTPAGSSTPLSAPPAKPASYVAPTTLTPGTPNAPVSATKAGPIKASDLQWPMKITTSVIHTMKYQHGAVVAYRKNPDGSLSRLAWSGTTKKFISQNQLPDGSWQTFAGYTKKDAYGTFGKAGYAGSWFSPPPGDSAIGSGGPFGTTSVAPKVSTSAPAPSTVTTAPAPAPVKQEKFDAAELQKLHGQIPAGMWPGKERELFDDFKKNSSVGFVSLSSPEASLFTALHETLVKNNDLAKVSSLIKPLNMLQLLKIIDEESTNKANAIAKSKGEAGDLVNAQLYEKKLVAWLQTPSGATYATEILYPPPPAPYDPSGPINANKTYKSPNFTPQIIDTLHKIKDPAQIGTPDPKANVFAPISHSKALELQKIQLANDPWTTTQKNALAKYTGSYYSEMNPIIRDIVEETKYKSETTLLTAARTAVNIQAGMRPLPESVKVFRKTNPDQFSAFGLNHSSKFADIKKLEGKLFIDQAPMSTSIDPNKWSGTVHFEIDLPKGTPAIYVDNISDHKGEMEMILALGLKYRIISVKEQYGTTKVHMRVEA